MMKHTRDQRWFDGLVGITFAISLLCHLVVVDWAQGQEDDHGQTEATATVIEPNSETEGFLDSDQDADVFLVILDKTGRLTIETTGQVDTIGALFTSLAGCPETGSILKGEDLCDEEPFIVDDNSGEDLNFRFSEGLTAGMYFIVVETAVPDESGPYTLVSTFTAEDGGDIKLPGFGIDDGGGGAMSPWTLLLGVLLLIQRAVRRSWRA